MKYIGDFLDGRKNNFDFMRFLAASLVIFSHVYPLTWGNDGYEPLNMLSGGQATIGRVSVAIFFVISGFLITQSYDRSRNLFSFLKNRILRIYPGLILLIFFTLFILGPTITTLPFKEYITHPGTYEYFRLLKLHNPPYIVPGTFSNNPYPSAMNGSIWTLEFEVVCYLGVAILGLCRLLKKEIILVLLALLLIWPYFIGYGKFYYTSSISIELFSFFVSGILMYTFRHKIPLNGYLFSASIVILMIGLAYGYFISLFIVFGAYAIMYLAFKPTNKLWNFSKYGDFSYGIYIYAFPIEQTIAMLLGKNITPAKLFLFTFPITLLLAIISWHLIEKHALKLKNLKFGINLKLFDSKKSKKTISSTE